MYKLEEKLYTFFLVLLVIGELFLTIPMATDSLIEKEQTNFITYLIIGHVVAWGYTAMLDNKGVRSFHIKGVISFFISFIPLLSFVWHGYVAFSGVFAIKQMFSFIRYDYDPKYEKQKEIKELKRKRKRKERTRREPIEETREPVKSLPPPKHHLKPTQNRSVGQKKQDRPNVPPKPTRPVRQKPTSSNKPPIRKVKKVVKKRN